MASEEKQETNPSPPRSTVPEALLMAGGLILFLAMLFEMRRPLISSTFINPLLLAGAGVMLLWPLRAQRPARTLLLAGGLFLLLWLLTELGMVLMPFMLVFLMAYLLNPLVVRLRERFKVARWISAVGVTMLVVSLVTLFIVGLMPSLFAEVETLAARALDGVGQVQVWLSSANVLDRFEAAGLINKEEFVTQATNSMRELAGSLVENLPLLAQQLIGHISSLFGLITIVAVMPVLLFYTLKDYPIIKDRLEHFFPTFGGNRDYLVQAGEVVGSYLRGQFILCAIAAFNVSVLLLIFDVPFALLIGVMTGLLNLVPNFGAVVSAIVGVLIAVIFSDAWFVDALTVFLVLTGQNLLEQSILVPKIMSRQVGLHPVLILFALFLFGYLFGVLGLVIAVPLTALLMTAYRAFRHELTFDLSPAPRRKPELARRLRLRYRKKQAAQEPE